MLSMIVVACLMLIMLIVLLMFWLQLGLSDKMSKNLLQISPLESGFESVKLSASSLSSPFMFLTVIFVLFDLEIIFLFPLISQWSTAVFYMVLIVITVFMLMTLIYEWKFSGLKWQM